jgi:hypothetical protein
MANSIPAVFTDNDSLYKSRENRNFKEEIDLCYIVMLNLSVEVKKRNQYNNLLVYLFIQTNLTNEDV